MESSDLGFSEDRNHADEHLYQIGELGNFEIERSMSDENVGINKEQSVDFSDGDFSDDMMHSDLSRLAALDLLE